ncbi:MAG: PaaI family thioesterase [Ignavibacteriaceae bacterium]|nr:PaaI family thioesterase [Ignavibacteriaceae bacterium]
MRVDAEQLITLSARNGHAHCLLCGQQNPRSWGLFFHRGEGTSVHGTLHPNDGLQGYDGMLHGGVIASLLDAAMTHCLFHLGVQAVTGDLHVRFVQPVSCCATVDVRAHIASASPPLYYLKAELLEGDRVMAWGEATLIRRDRGRMARE